VSRRVRVALFAPALAVLGALLFWAFAGLPDFGSYRGPYGFVLNRVVVPERHTANVVNATVYDYRGVDTLGEEFIFFAAVAGVVLLLRREARGEQAAHDSDTTRSDAVRVTGILLVGAAILVALWIAAFGFVTPGGGFQGGVAAAGGAVLVYAASSYRGWTGLAGVEFLDPLEALGAGGYVVIGLAALVSGMPFLANLLAPGTTGTLLSGGTAPFVNWAAAIEVAAALVVLFREFLEEYVVPLSESRR
jgi:multicomponent Na+:H+ antiporter subunit B